MLKGMENSTKFLFRLIMDFCSRPVFRVGVTVAVAVAAAVIGLTAPVTDKTEDEKDLLRKLDISESKTIFNASLRYEEREKNNAIFYYCTLEDGQEGIGIVLACLKDGIWQIELDKKYHLDADVMYFTGEYTAGEEKYNIYAGYIASPDAVEVRAVTTDGTVFKNNLFRRVGSRSYFLLDVPSKYSHPEINILDKNGNTINSAGNVSKTEPSAVNKSDLTGIAYNGNNVYVAIDSMGKIFISTDVRNWTNSQSGTNNILRTVTWGGKQFVAAGDKGAILTSKDGSNWTNADSGVNTNLLKVIWDGRQYIAFGSGKVLTSADGAVWTGKEAPEMELNNGTVEKLSYNIADMIWDGKQYIAAGGGNFILTSADLDKWTVRVPNSMGTGMFYDMAWNGKRYAAVGDHLAMMTSLDGHKWTNEDCRINKIEAIDDFYTLHLRSVVWGRDKFVAVGQR